MEITSRDIVAILKTIQELGYRRFRMEHGNLVLEVDTEGGTSAAGEAASVRPGTSAAAAKSQKSSPAKSDRAPKEGAVAVRAPMTGTFYRAPSPGAPPFVEIGRDVRADQVVCIVEVMKLFNSIAAGVAGRVLEICVENESPIAAGQAIIWIDPSPGRS